MPNDFHEGDMALELAEREFLAMSLNELVDLARLALENEWIDLAEKAPQLVQAHYKSMKGE